MECFTLCKTFILTFFFWLKSSDLAIVQGCPGALTGSPAPARCQLPTFTDGYGCLGPWAHCSVSSQGRGPWGPQSPLAGLEPCAEETQINLLI